METKKSETILILGISDNEERYSFKAATKLLQNGYKNMWGVTPKNIRINGVKIVSNLADIAEKIHTVTVYVSSEKVNDLVEQIIKLNPKRIILNPGTENEALITAAKNNGIEALEACTLVLLSTKQF